MLIGYMIIVLYYISLSAEMIKHKSLDILLNPFRQIHKRLSMTNDQMLCMRNSSQRFLLDSKIEIETFNTTKG